MLQRVDRRVAGDTRHKRIDRDFPQVEQADVVLSIRSDFYETHPVFGMVVNQTVKRNAAELFVIGDKNGKFGKLPGAKTLLHKPGLEVNILNAMSQALIEDGSALIEGVEGLDTLKKTLSAYTPETVSEMTGVAAEDIRSAAKALVGAKRSAILLAYGLPYTAQSKEIAIAAANLAILCGNVDKEQSGLYLCGEKANSQGAVDLGIFPAADGMGAQQMLEAAGQGKLSALYVVGEDPMTSYPDRSKVEKAFATADFVVVHDLFLSPTAELADVVLPAASFAEKNGTFTNAERRIQRVRSGVPSPGEAKTDYDILSLLASRFGETVSYTGPEALFSALADEAGYTGIGYEQIGPQGAVWGGESLSVNKKVLVAVDGAKPVEGDFVLLTGSALYHSGTMSTRATGPQAVLGEAYVEFNFEDAKALKIEDKALVSIKADGVELKLKAKVGKRLPKGVLFAPYHFAEARINSLYKGEAAISVQVGK